MRDFLHQPDGDLDLSSGDIVMTDATLQHQRDIILTSPGALKHAPARGVGVQDYFNDDSKESMLRKIRQEIVRDGARINRLQVSTTGQIQIESYYEADYNS